MNLYVIPGDKANHLIYGTAIATIAATIARFAAPSLSHNQCRVIGATAAVLAGLLKEWSDSRANRKAIAAGRPPPHEVSKADAFWTVGGGLAYIILSNL